MRALKILFYSIITLVVVAFAVGRFVDSNTIDGEGPVTEKDIEVSGFDQIRISGGWDAHLSTGEGYGLTVNVQENLQDHVKVSIEGNTLSIGVDGNVSTSEKMEVIISAPEISAIDLSGASELRTNTRLQSSSLELECSGASELYVEVECDQIDLDLSGASEAYLEGSVDKLTVDASGAAKFYGVSCEASAAVIGASGASYAETNVSTSLKANASGASKIKYTGDATDISRSASGASSVSRK